jgi:hypothetical protein
VLVIGVPVTYNTEYEYLCMEYADYVSNAVECVLTFFVLYVFHSVLSCVVTSVLRGSFCIIYGGWGLCAAV